MKSIFVTKKMTVSVEPNGERISSQGIITPLLGYSKDTLRDGSKEVKLVMGWAVWMLTITINIVRHD